MAKTNALSNTFLLLGEIIRCLTGEGTCLQRVQLYPLDERINLSVLPQVDRKYKLKCLYFHHIIGPFFLL